MARPFHIEFDSLREEVRKRLVSSVCSPWNWWTRSFFLHLLCSTSKPNLPPLRTSATHVDDDNGEASNFHSFIPDIQYINFQISFIRSWSVNNIFYISVCSHFGNCWLYCSSVSLLGVIIMRETCYTRYKLGHQVIHNCHLGADTLAFLSINDISNVIIGREHAWNIAY